MDKNGITTIQVILWKKSIEKEQIREMYQVWDGFCFSAISFDRVNILSFYTDQIKANVFAQLLSVDSILISYTEKKL